MHLLAIYRARRLRRTRGSNPQVNILLVGWAGDRTAVICDMLNRYAAPGSTVVVLSEIPLKERTATTKVHQVRPSSPLLRSGSLPAEPSLPACSV